MDKRINIQNIDDEAYKAMFALEKYLTNSSLSVSLKELIKIRASQINGCAYCIDMHTAEALKNGESQRRIFAVSAWWESPLFDKNEKMALKMTDEVTLIAKNGLSTETYQNAAEIFNEKELAEIIMQIVTINAWNRIAVSTRLFHEK